MMGMERPIGVGLIGVSAQRGWAALAHIPALRALPEYRIAAIANRSAQSAEEAAAHFGVPLAFGDSRALVAHPDVDLVVITARVTEHDALVRQAIGAGRHVYCEWPLGVDLAQAESLAVLARQSGARTAIGLQGYQSAGAHKVWALIEGGAIGRPTAFSVFGSGGPHGPVTPQAYRYTLDEAAGATILTVSAAHWLAAIELMLGPIVHISATALTVVDETVIAETGARAPVNAPDQIAIGARFDNGALLSLSVHSGVAPSALGFRAMLAGTEGTLTIEPASGGSFHMADWKLALHRPGRDVETIVPEDDLSGLVPAGPARNVARTYRALAPAIRDPGLEDGRIASFGMALRFHRLIAAIDRAAKSGTAGKADL